MPADAPDTYRIVATCVAPGDEAPTVYERDVPGDGTTWVSISPLQPDTECEATEPDSHGAELTLSTPWVAIAADASSDVVVTNTFPQQPEEPQEPDLPTLPQPEPPTGMSSLAVTGPDQLQRLTAALIAFAVTGGLFVVLAIAWRRRTQE